MQDIKRVSARPKSLTINMSPKPYDSTQMTKNFKMKCLIYWLKCFPQVLSPVR